jgi:hypothetical protein
MHVNQSTSVCRDEKCLGQRQQQALASLYVSGTAPGVFALHCTASQASHEHGYVSRILPSGLSSLAGMQ